MNRDHVAMTSERAEQIKTQCTYPIDAPLISGSIGSMLGFPVIIDESLPPVPGWEFRTVDHD